MFVGLTLGALRFPASAQSSLFRFHLVSLFLVQLEEQALSQLHVADQGSLKQGFVLYGSSRKW